MTRILHTDQQSRNKVDAVASEGCPLRDIRDAVEARFGLDLTIDELVLLLRARPQLRSST